MFLVVYFIEDVAFSVGQLRFSIVQTPAEQTRHPELPFLQPRTNVSRAQFTNGFLSFLKTYQAIWTPSSSPWGQAWPHLPHLQVLQTLLPRKFKKMDLSQGHAAWSSVRKLRTDPWEDDIAGLRHRSLSAVYVQHRLFHQHIIQFTPVWPASSYCCSAGQWILSLITQHTSTNPLKNAFWKVAHYLRHGLQASPTPQTAPVLCFWSPSLWRLHPSPPPLQSWKPSPDRGHADRTCLLSVSCGSTLAPAVMTTPRHEFKYKEWHFWLPERMQLPVHPCSLTRQEILLN